MCKIMRVTNHIVLLGILALKIYEQGFFTAFAQWAAIVIATIAFCK